MMYRLTLFVVSAISAAGVQGSCREGCEVPLAHYEEVGCKAMNARRGCCPSHYDCSKFFSQPADKCHFKDSVYNLQQQIPDNLTEIHCAAACFCSRDDLQDITCANIECPEMMGYPIPLDPGCYFAYELDGCCTSKTVCPPLDKLATCEVNGKKYYEGEEMQAPGRERELKCVCQPNFQGKFEEPFCIKRTCGIELRDTKYMRDKCAPVYYGGLLQCPIQWECPQEGDSIVPNTDSSTSDQKCLYGQQQLNVGDKLMLNRSVHSPEINCDCRIPPLVTCIQKPYSYETSQ